MATVARSAEEARDLLVLRPDDGITMNRDRLLADAKARMAADEAAAVVTARAIALLAQDFGAAQ